MAITTFNNLLKLENSYEGDKPFLCSRCWSHEGQWLVLLFDCVISDSSMDGLTRKQDGALSKAVHGSFLNLEVVRPFVNKSAGSCPESTKWKFNGRANSSSNSTFILLMSLILILANTFLGFVLLVNSHTNTICVSAVTYIFSNSTEEYGLNNSGRHLMVNIAASSSKVGKVLSLIWATLA